MSRAVGSPPARTMGPAAAVLLAITLVAIVIGFRLPGAAHALAQSELGNPDSYYKLVLLEDHVPGSGFSFVARDNAPFGSWTHWSMVHSATVWQLHRVLRLTGLDEDPALRYAGGLLTLLSMVAVALFVALAVARASTPRAAVLSGLVLATSVPFHSYGRAIQLTHHIFMLLPLAMAAACLLQVPQMSRHLWRDACGGLLLGLALWISPETMPFVVGLVGVRAALRLQYTDSPGLWPIAAALPLMTVLAWRCDPPPPGFSPWALDHVSLGYVTLSALLGALLLAADACAYRRMSLRHSLPLLIVLAVGMGVAWLWTVPGALNGPAGLVPEKLRHLFWDHIRELKSADSPAKLVAFLMMPLCGAVLAGLRAWRDRALWLAAVAVLALAYGGLAVWHIRMGAAAAVASALALPLGAAMLRGFDPANDAALARRELAIAVLVALLPYLQLLSFAMLTRLSGVPGPGDPSICSLRSVAPALNRLAAATFLTPLSNAPELLYRTHHRTIAGPYHHNIDGMLDSFDAWLDEGGTAARTIVRARKIDYVLACNHLQAELVGGDGRRTLAQRAVDGDVPAWLKPIDWPAGVDTPWHLYRVLPQLMDSDVPDARTDDGAPSG